MPYDTRAKQPLNQHAPAPPTAPPDQTTLSELKAEVMKLSDVLCKKIDSIHCKISDIETSLKDTSDRALNIEQYVIPQLRNEHKAEVAALEKKILMMEIYQRKGNLLFYGVEQAREENVYEKLVNFFIELGLPREEAAGIMIINAHRLPRKTRNIDGSPARDQGPEPIIAKFAIMRDRQHILDAYLARSKNVTDSDDQATSQGAPRGTRSRISVRTDLPPCMKFRRGKLASVAYRLRKENNMSTKILVQGTDVILKFKGKSEREWKTYNDE